MDLITVDNRTDETEAECKHRLDELVNCYKETDQYVVTRLGEEELRPYTQPLYAIGEKKETRKNKLSTKRISSILQTFILFHRLFKNTMRNKTLVFGKIAEAILMGIIVGLIFFQLNANSAVDIRSTVSAVYAAASMQPYLILLGAMIQSIFFIPLFPLQGSLLCFLFYPFLSLFFSVPFPLPFSSPFTSSQFLAFFSSPFPPSYSLPSPTLFPPSHALPLRLFL